MLLFMDGMAHYDSSRISLKYTTVNAVGVTWAITSEGRFGNCLTRVSTSNVGTSGYLGITPFTTRAGYWTPPPGGVCGFAIKVDDLARVGSAPPGLSPYGLLVVEETAMGSPVGAGAFHLRVDLQPNGTFTLSRRGTGLGGDVILANSIKGLTSNAWAYVECKWLIDDTVGTFEIRVNTIPVLTYSGDTRVSDAANFGVWNSVRLFTVNAVSGGGLVLRASDLYLADLTAPNAADVHDCLGDGQVATIMPNAAGASTGWTPAGATNWDTQHDRPAPDDDATYVRAVTAGTQDTYQFEDIPVGSVVKAAQLSLLPRKETEGSATLAPLVHQGATDYVGPTQGVGNILYDRYLLQPYDLNPATAAAWTDATINAGQWGLRKQT
jgi:hypothetical protein